MKTKKKQINFKRGQANPLPVMEQFYTLQGEGSWTGTAAWFIRLAGCDVGCHWCDVKESWTASKNQYLPVAEIVAQALASGTEKVVITGGEPTIYDLSSLTAELRQSGLKVHMETAGPHPLTGEFDWICLSPKKFLPPLSEYYQHAHELKVVIYNHHDFQWAEEHAALCPPHVKRFLQPEWSRREAFTPHIVEYIKRHPKWRLSLQTHKYIDIP